MSGRTRVLLTVAAFVFGDARRGTGPRADDDSNSTGNMRAYPHTYRRARPMADNARENTHPTP